MSALYIQTFRDGEWLHVTTIPVEAKSHHTDSDREWKRAYRDAQRQLNGWRDYFADVPMRIAEKTTFGNFREAQV